MTTGHRDLHHELEEQIHELDAFAYSISHDLRAPLRSLDGFSQILLEEHAAGLDDEGRRYLERIRANVERMTEMMDALLELSSAARSQLHRERTDLSALARDVAAELTATDPGRSVRFAIADGLSAPGDPHLIRMVLQNLLGNAFKFTGRRADALIEFDTERQDGVDVYTVRDNGAGFEPGHADRMFDPFQRLHLASEFEGTGVGLAIVRRVVTRHGGQITAAGAPDEGAVVRFTLAPGPAGWELR
ncbi:ATP-binding protein [Actinoplanes sp. TRM 88003]|uniref:Sensor-like histidine kinase SenX3 n=1 Tax=Paractinoplanes aksuensis TaxID=2939490 RepID=A0ABT1DPQ6_9ACTN|nr:ATP-binding protein [Actinoplanes aksuensis]MCO8272810.1 ATP-binding protein [Actinoplanes aksuensis]